MDRALYVGMSGAIQTMLAQAANSNNLANASTTGFRAQLVDAQAAAVDGPGLPSLVDATLLDQGWDSSQGSIQSTGNDLDVAMTGQHWLAVQAPDGGEAYTKAGDLNVDVNGVLRTGTGLPVLGDNGPLTVTPGSRVTIGGDGTVSVIAPGQSAAAPATVGRLKIVTASQQELIRGEDGLFRAEPGHSPDAASGTVLVSGALEGSNVNLAGAMVNMIQLSRQFELQTKVMHAAEDNASASSSLVKMS